MTILRFILYEEMQIQIPPESRQVMQMKIKYNLKKTNKQHSSLINGKYHFVPAGMQ